MRLYLTPRLNYGYSMSDLAISLLGLIRSNFNVSPLINLFKTEKIYFVNHARTGLRLLLNSFELPPNARVGVQILNCDTVFTAIVKAGYTPIFIDINENLTMSLDDLKKKLNQIDALIVTHIFGIPGEIEKIKNITKEKPIIEDCAHSFLSKKCGKLTGTFGDAAVFSFGKAKFPSIGEGGFVVINKKSIISNFEEYYSGLKSYNWLKEFNNIRKSIVQHILHTKIVYRFITLPFLKKTNNVLNLFRKNEFIEKRVLKSNLALFLQKYNKFESYVEHQTLNAISLLKYLNKFDDLNYIQLEDNSKSNFFMLPVISGDKQKLLNYFYNMGVEIGPHFKRSIEWAKELGYKDNDCKNAETIIPNLVLFPTYKSIKFQ